MKRFAKILTGVIILIFCLPMPAKSFDWKELKDMSREEVDVKLEEVRGVRGEIILVSALDEKIVKRRYLGEEEKEIFLNLARKYKLQPTSRLQTIISKMEWSRGDRKFLFAQLGLVIGHQKAAIKDHLNIRYWLNTKMRTRRDLNYNVRLQERYKKNTRKIEEYRDFVADITVYEKRLRHHKT